MSASLQDKPHKKLIVFCDGTWNKADQKTADGRPCPTNVSKLFEATCPCDCNGSPQITYYLQGVGTRMSERLRGGGFGYGISDNIKSAYQFICSNYRPGDEIFLFGFSRGAYTARSIAGLIHNMGILKRTDFHLVDEAYRHYKDRKPEWHPKSPEALKFREQHTWGNEEIKFIGVWDTVGALGAPYGIFIRAILNLLFRCGFHDVKLSSTIKSGFHALAIDEKRWPFRPTLWELSSQHDKNNFEERWFPGVHADVGGGYPDTGISDLSLRWMAQKAKAHGMGVALTNIAYRSFAPDILATPNNSQTILYRLATILFVKLPSYLGLVLPSENSPHVGHVQNNGDYIRPIANPVDIGNEAIDKKVRDRCYSPLNVP